MNPPMETPSGETEGAGNTTAGSSAKSTPAPLNWGELEGQAPPVPTCLCGRKSLPGRGSPWKCIYCWEGAE